MTQLHRGLGRDELAKTKKPRDKKVDKEEEKEKYTPKIIKRGSGCSRHKIPSEERWPRDADGGCYPYLFKTTKTTMKHRCNNSNNACTNHTREVPKTNFSRRLDRWGHSLSQPILYRCSSPNHEPRIPTLPSQLLSSSFVSSSTSSADTDSSAIEGIYPGKVKNLIRHFNSLEESKQYVDVIFDRNRLLDGCLRGLVESRIRQFEGDDYIPIIYFEELSIVSIPKTKENPAKPKLSGNCDICYSVMKSKENCHQSAQSENEPEYTYSDTCPDTESESESDTYQDTYTHSDSDSDSDSELSLDSDPDSGSGSDSDCLDFEGDPIDLLLYLFSVKMMEKF